MSSEELDEATFQIRGQDLDWEAMERWIEDGVDPQDLDNLETPFGETIEGLLDYARINAAEDPEAETVRQANEILRSDLAICKNLLADPGSGGEVAGKPAIEVTPDRVVITRGSFEPEEGNLSSPHWRFTRLDLCGALRVGGIVLD